jgi:hypothetical protein
MTTSAAMFVAFIVATAGRPLVAQSDSTSSSLACASRGAGARVSIGAGATARSSSVLDTTIVLRIADRTWTRDSVDAGVALGAAGMAGARSAPWNVCTGATVSLGRVTASLHGVYGQIHLRIDPSALSALANPTAAPTRK